MPSKFGLFKRSNGYFYVRYLRDGRMVWKSTGCSLKRDALRELSEFRKLLERGEMVPDKRLSGFAVEVSEFAGQSFAGTTARLYSDALERLREVLGDVRLRAITRREVDTFKAERSKIIKPVSVNRELRTLKAAFNIALRWKYVAENPFARVAFLRVPEKQPEYFTEDQFRCLLSAIGESWFRDVVLFAFATGMRAGELVSLCWDAVDFERRTVTVKNRANFQTKTGRQRTIPLNDAALAVLRRRNGRDECERVFTYRGRSVKVDGLSHAFKRAVRLAGLPEHLRFHSLRHSHATHLAMRGVSLYIIGQLLGHSDAKTTRVYSHVQPETLHSTVNLLPVISQN